MASIQLVYNSKSKDYHFVLLEEGNDDNIITDFGALEPNDLDDPDDYTLLNLQFG